jgi:hypothetical protein
MATAFVGSDRTVLLTIALSGPVTAPIGTFTLSRLELPARTRAAVSSDLPWLPVNTILTTPSSADPVIRSVLPP